MAEIEKSKAIVGLGVIAIIVVLMIWTSSQLDPTNSPPPGAGPRPAKTDWTAPTQAPSTSEAVEVSENPAIQPTPSPVARPGTGPTTSLPMGQEPGSLETDLDEVQSALRDFRSAIGENPVGTNAEITKALLGDNLKQIKLPVPSGSQLNGTGELCDRWGTPYFFHQLSGSHMEIRSAGPDRKMWTGDDRQM